MGAAWKNGCVSTSFASTPVPREVQSDEMDTTRQVLRHVMVVGGTLGEWARDTEALWQDRVGLLGAVADQAGASFLTVRAFEQGAHTVDLQRWEHRVGNCQVIVDPCGDGRQRFAEAMQVLHPDEPVNEATVAEALYAPADCEPDLIVVLGPSTRLPPSLVWELAYGELVFLPMVWRDLDSQHLVDAIADFAQRERRFGGLEE